MNYSIKKAAELLKVYRKDKPNILIGQHLLFKYLREIKVLMDNNRPYPKYAHFFVIQERNKEVEIASKRERFAIPVTYITPLGLLKLRKRMEIDGYEFEPQGIINF